MLLPSPHLIAVSCSEWRASTNCFDIETSPVVPPSASSGWNLFIYLLLDWKTKPRFKSKQHNRCCTSHRGISFNWTIVKRKAKLPPLVMFIAGGLFLFYSQTSLSGSCGRAGRRRELKITAACRSSENTHLTPARKCNYRPPEHKAWWVTLENSSRESFQFEKKMPLYLLWESAEKNQQTLIPLIDFWCSVTLIHSCDMFSGFFFFFPSGFYCRSGSAHPQLCDAGSYCDQTGLEVPAGHCAAGYYCPQGSSQATAAPCPRGHYCPLGTPLPLPCPPGTMKSQPECSFFSYFLSITLLLLHPSSQQFNYS